jgi:hypothetical protein
MLVSTTLLLHNTRRYLADRLHTSMAQPITSSAGSCRECVSYVLLAVQGNPEDNKQQQRSQSQAKE